MNKLKSTINYIVKQSVELKNEYTDEVKVPIEFVCIFCQDELEFKGYTAEIEKLGKVVEKTKSGMTYLLKEKMETMAGPLRLVKIRIPDVNFTERGDADFNTNYLEFKRKYGDDFNFELVKRDLFEMLRLSCPDYDVMVCFSNKPKCKILKIK